NFKQKTFNWERKKDSPKFGMK
ncbi:hypothetical protein TNCV_989181, partial [Trichonephila clavipes]